MIGYIFTLVAFVSCHMKAEVAGRVFNETAFRNALWSGSIIVRNVDAPVGAYQNVTVMFASDPYNVSVLETCTGYYVRPTGRHFKYQFEQFFGLGCGNWGYHEDLCTFVPKA